MNPNRRQCPTPNRHRGRGFTLVELLVVILIIGLVSAATLPVVLPALSHRQVSEGARLLQATLAGARDSALRANAPRGVRLLPDPAFPGPNPLAANRMIAIEPAPDYSSGRVSLRDEDINYSALTGNVTYPTVERISISESVVTTPTFTTVDEPTSWYWNIRQGDKIRFDDSGRFYTIAGPLQIGAFTGGQPTNVERYVNFGAPGQVPRALTPPYDPTIGPARVNNDPSPVAGFMTHLPERLYLVNGQDDDGDGFVDEGFDGIDNDGDGVVDPG